MSVVEFLLSGANLPFVVALGVGVLYVLVSASGVAALLTDGATGEPGAGAHAEVAVAAEAADGGEVGPEAGSDPEAGAHDADGDGRSVTEAGGSTARGLGAPARAPTARETIAARPVAVAAGQLPLSVRGPIALVVAGVGGLVMNALVYAESAAVPLLSLAWTSPIAIGTSVVAGRFIGLALAPILDDRASRATSRRDLVGGFGTVISSAVRQDFGEVRFKDRSGHFVRLVVKLAPDAPPLREGEEAVVVDLDERGTPLVARLDVRP